MQAFPHLYVATASGQQSGRLSLNSGDLPAFESAPPVEFGGPGDRWSPETLLVAAVADCFILTFRAIANASKFPWSELTCEVVGTLDRVERVTRFTHFLVKPRLMLPPDGDEELARRLLEKAEHGCLVSNSLSATKELEPHVERRAA